MKLIDYIEQEMASDDDRHRQSGKLRAVYENADERQRKALDDAFCALCGWTLATVIANNPRTFEVTPRGFDGGTDATDEDIKWIRAPSLADVTRRYPDATVTELEDDEHIGDEDIDETITADGSTTT